MPTLISRQLVQKSVRKLTHRSRKLYLGIKHYGTPYRIVTQEEVLRSKSSTTLIILATGASVNDITDSQWDWISKHDTIAMNDWYLHRFVPKYLNYEPRWWSTEFYKRWLQLEEEYKDVIFFINGISYKKCFHPRYSPEAFPRNPRIFVGPDPVKKAFPKSSQLDEGAFIDCPLSFGQPQWLVRSSVTEVVHRAVQLDYSHIILIGVDLNTLTYFYENEKYGQYRDKGILNSKAVKKYPSSWVRTMKVEGKHVATNYGPYHAVDQYLPAFDRFVVQPNGKKLYIGSKKSLLFPSLCFHPLCD